MRADSAGAAAAHRIALTVIRFRFRPCSRRAPPAASTDPTDHHASQETTIVNKLGLHARASAKLTQLAGNFQSEVWMSRNGRKINAKSIMGVMMLAAGIGSTITIETDGPDEKEAMDALLKLIADKFGEGQ
nr:phosphotransferase system, phosphocarrier protein HPr [Burkholderia multivorans]